MGGSNRGSGGGITRRSVLLGLGAIFSGAGLMTSAGALDAVTAPRSTNVGVSDDPNAFLGLDGYVDTNETPTFTNNTTSSLDVTLDSQDDVEFDVGTDGIWTAPPVTFSLAADGTKEVDIRWVGDCVGAGSAIVSTDADVVDDSDNNTGLISFDREWEIPESGQIQFNGSVNSAGASGKYEFSIENAGCDNVTFTGIGINETTTSADYVSGGGSLFNVDTGDELVTDSIPIDSTDPDNDTRRDMNPTVTVLQNDSVTFEFDRFEQNGQGNTKVDMRGQDVRVTLYLSDGSSATEMLCLGSCDF